MIRCFISLCLLSVVFLGTSRIDVCAGPIPQPTPVVPPLPSPSGSKPISSSEGVVLESHYYPVRVARGGSNSGGGFGAALAGAVGGLAVGVSPTASANAAVGMHDSKEEKYTWEGRVRVRVRLSSGRVVEIVQLGSEKSFLKGMPVEVVTFPGGIDRVAPTKEGELRRYPEPSIPRQ